MTDSPWYWQDAQRCCLSIARIITLRSLLASNFVSVSAFEPDRQLI